MSGDDVPVNMGADVAEALVVDPRRSAALAGLRKDAAHGVCHERNFAEDADLDVRRQVGQMLAVIGKSERAPSRTPLLVGEEDRAMTQGRDEGGIA